MQICAMMLFNRVHISLQNIHMTSAILYLYLFCKYDIWNTKPCCGTIWQM